MPWSWQKDTNPAYVTRPLGPSYIASFSPASGGWNFVAITWRTSTRAEMVASTPNMKLCAKSLRRIKMHGDTNRQNWPIGSLEVWPFVGTQSLNFWNSIQKPTMMMERKQKRNLSLAAYLSARETHLHRKKNNTSSSLPIYASLTALVLFNLVSMFSYSIWALKLKRFSILPLLFHWNSFYFAANSGTLRPRWPLRTKFPTLPQDPICAPLLALHNFCLLLKCLINGKPKTQRQYKTLWATNKQTNKEKFVNYFILSPFDNENYRFSVPFATLSS